MAFWRTRSNKQRDGSDDGTGSADDPTTTDAPTDSGDPAVADGLNNIDGKRWGPEVQVDPARAAELAERFRSRAARLEAQRDLERLRQRHWSGERIIEEARKPDEWWEHPEADPFAVLGLMPGTPLSEAATARRRVAMECHPDRLPEGADPDIALRRMVAANSAYDRLRRAMHPAP